MARIFLSYRRDDTAGHTGRIFDHFTEYFGEGRVFMDVEGLDAGENFVAAVEQRIKECDAFVVVIGKGWLGEDASGKRRLDDPADYVRQEIEAAFRIGVDVVPVLVGGARIPAGRELPESLSALSLRNAFVIDDRAFLSGVDRLIPALEKTAARARERKRSERPSRKEKEAAVAVKATGSSVRGDEKDVVPARSATRRQLWKGMRKLLLLYEPSYPATWILHVFFYVGLSVLGIAALTLVLMGEFGDAVPVIATYVAMLTALRAIAAAVEPETVSSGLRHWWLLYKAPRAGTTVLQVVFFLMLLFTSLMSAGLPAMIADQTSGLAKWTIVCTGICMIVVTFVIREVAATQDPLRPAGLDRNWFSRVFYVWHPRRSISWVPRVVWYTSAFLLLLRLGPDVFADDEGNFDLRSITGNRVSISYVVLFLATAISARGWVRSLEAPRRRTVKARNGWRQFLPLSTPSQARGWVPILLFWGSIGLLVAVLIRRDLLVPLLGDAKYETAALAVLTAVGASYWARMFQGRDVPVSVSMDDDSSPTV
jgi:hypothetical protein